MSQRSKLENQDIGKRVGIWIRVSTDDQAQGESPQHHEKRARHYAEAKGWKVEELYNLSGVSGKSILGHPETKRMLSDVQQGRITGLIFSKMARLARNTKELLELSDIFREFGADLISLNEAIDTTSPAGRLFYTMIAALAQWEREEIAERVAASVSIRAKLGKPLGGTAPFGYQWKDKRLVPNPNEVAVRRLIYELYLEYKRMKTVARVLNERGYRTRNRSRFTTPTVHRLLRDSTAMGLHRSNYTTQSKDGQRWIEKPQSEWVYNPVEAIVSEEVWKHCNEILDQLRDKRQRRGRRPVHLFAGVTKCHCGKRMYVPTKMAKYYCQICHNKIRIVDLETIYHDQLKRFYFSQEELAQYLGRAQSTMKEQEGLITLLETERRENGHEMDRLYRLYMNDGISIEEFRRRYRKLEERQKQIEHELPAIQARIDFAKIQLVNSEEVISEARNLYTRWPALSIQEKRQIVETITESITVGKDEISLTLNYLGGSEIDHKMVTQPSTPVIEKQRSAIGVTDHEPSFFPSRPFKQGDSRVRAAFLATRCKRATLAHHNPLKILLLLNCPGLASGAPEAAGTWFGAHKENRLSPCREPASAVNHAMAMAPAAPSGTEAGRENVTIRVVAPRPPAFNGRQT